MEIDILYEILDGSLIDNTKTKNDKNAPLYMLRTTDYIVVNKEGDISIGVFETNEVNIIPVLHCQYMSIRYFLNYNKNHTISFKSGAFNIPFEDIAEVQMANKSYNNIER